MTVERRGEKLAGLIGKKSFKEFAMAIIPPLRPRREVILETLPEKPHVLPLSASQMVELTGLASRTIYDWAKQKIIGQKTATRCQFTQKDLLICATILKRGKRTTFEEKKAISQAIKTDQPEEEIFTIKRFAESIQIFPSTVYNWARQGEIGSQQTPRGRWRFSQEDLKKAYEIKKERKKKEEKRRVIEKLTNLKKVLKKTELSKPLLGLRETAEFLREISPNHYPSHGTLEKIFKIAVILGDFPLPPETIRVTPGGNWHYRFTQKEELNTVLNVTLQILETRDLSLEKAFQQAKKTFKGEREKRIPVENLFPEIKARKIIIENLQKGKLPPLYEVKPQEILVLGVPEENQEDFVEFWAGFIKEKQAKPEKLLPTDIYKNWPALSSFLKEQLSEEIKIDSRSLPYAVAWLKAKGMPVETVRRGRPRQEQRRNPIFYHRISSQGKKQLESLLKIPKEREELKRILKGGFSLEEILAYREYFPSDFHLSVTELFRLATGKRRWLSKEQKTQNIKTLEDNHITVIEELTFEGTLLHKVPLSEAKRAVALLERLKPEKKPVIFSTVQLGETIPISPTWIRQLAHQGLIGHHPGPETHWRFSQEDFNTLKELAEIKIEPRSDLISLRDARRKVGLSREKLIALCLRRKNPLFSPKGKPRLKEEIKEKGRYCLRMTDFEAILREEEILGKGGLL